MIKRVIYDDQALGEGSRRGSKQKLCCSTILIHRDIIVVVMVSNKIPPWEMS